LSSKSDIKMISEGHEILSTDVIGAENSIVKIY